MATLRDKITQDYNTISSTPAKSTLSGIDLQGAIAYAKDELRKSPTDPTLKAWLTIIAQRESDNTEIRAQLDDLKDFLDSGGKRIIPAPVFDRNPQVESVKAIPSIGHTVPGAISTPVEIKNGIQEVKEVLSEINPENLEKAITTSEKFINMLPAGDTQNTLRGVHGAIIFDTLRNAGHNITIQNNQITIVPKPGIDIVRLQEKLQTLVETKKISLDTIKIGMLYSSPTFAKYAADKQTVDKIVSQSANPQDFIKYVKDLKTAGDVAGDITTILGSQQMLQGVNMPQAIKGFRNMGQMGTWLQNNPSLANQVATITSQSSGSPAASPISSVPDTPSNRFTAQLGQDGKTGGVVTGIMGDATKGLFGGVGDLFKLANGDPMAQLGIGAALIYGVYKLFQKTGFFGGIASLLAIGGANSGTDIFDRVDKLLNGKSIKTTTTPPATSATTPATGASASPASTPTPGASLDISKLTPTHKKMYDKITADKDFIQSIDTFGENQSTQKKAETAKSDKYLEFIFSDKFQKLSLDKYIYTTNPDVSLFRSTETLDPSLSVPNNMNNALLKKMILLSLTGSTQRQLVSGKTIGDKEKDDFVSKYPEATWKSKSTADIISEIHK